MEDVLKKLRALAEPTRLRVVILLWRGELTVSELMRILGQSQPRVSRHLRLLVDAGIAERLPEGAWVFYRLSKSAVGRKLADLIEEMADSDDPDIGRDLARLEQVKAERAKAAAAYFETAAKDWERIRALHFPETDVEAAMLRAAGPGPFRRHLDIGTGTGRMLELFADRAQNGIGIDLSHQMLTVARSNIARAGLEDRFVRQADAGALPIESASADLITVHQVLHYMEDPARALAECARVLAPGGRLVIADFAPHSLEFLREEHHHRRLGIAPDLMARWLSAAGLDPAGIDELAPDQPGKRLTVLVWTATKTGGADASPQQTEQELAK
ncbi:metalloregulator ArsR/SmtB family transcription factor [Glycocaulis profundi]|nr:metalloregulator ArsR/SmtB family transcription factor [Glycocaulis profundi]